MAGKAMRAMKDEIQERMQEFVRTDRLTVDRVGDFRIAATEWSDYGGSILDRANGMWLGEHYSDVVTLRQLGGHGWYSCEISKSILNDAAFGEHGFRDTVARLRDVLDMIEGLSDYPLFSDDSVHAAKSEILAQSWDGYYRGEFSRALSDALEKECPACIAWEASEYGSGVPQCPQDHSDFDEDSAYAAFAEAAEGSEYTAAEVHFAGDMSAVVKAYRASL